MRTTANHLLIRAKGRHARLSQSIERAKADLLRLQKQVEDQTSELEDLARLITRYEARPVFRRTPGSVIPLTADELAAFRRLPDEVQTKMADEATNDEIRAYLAEHR